MLLVCTEIPCNLKGAITDFYLDYFEACAIVLSRFSHIWLFAAPLHPARLHYPWNFPGKNTGAGCHFLLDPRIKPASLVSPALVGRFFNTSTSIPLPQKLLAKLTNYICTNLNMEMDKLSLQKLRYPKKKSDKGFPWRSSGEESALRCTWHGFNPWSGKTSHALKRLCAPPVLTQSSRAQEPQLLNPHTASTEAHARQWEACTPQRSGAPACCN